MFLCPPSLKGTAPPELQIRPLASQSRPLPPLRRRFHRPTGSIQWIHVGMLPSEPSSKAGPVRHHLKSHSTTVAVSVRTRLVHLPKRTAQSTAARILRQAAPPVPLVLELLVLLVMWKTGIPSPVVLNSMQYAQPIFTRRALEYSRTSCTILGPSCGPPCQE